jgi:hypothetical protein
MPVHKVGSGYQWGSHGKVYKGAGAAKKAAAQGAAAYASGYKGNSGEGKLAKMQRQKMKP